jgi:hypothetical protein
MREHRVSWLVLTVLLVLMAAWSAVAPSVRGRDHPPLASASASPAPGSSASSTPTRSATPSPTKTATPIGWLTPTAGPSITSTATRRPSLTPTATATHTPRLPSPTPTLPVQRGLLPAVMRDHPMRTPTFVGLVGQAGGIATAVGAEGNYAYVAVGLRLLVMEVSDRQHPMHLGQTDILSGVAHRVLVVGKRAYLALGDGGLSIVDVANPARPVEAGRYDTAISAVDMAIAGNHAFVADEHAGVRVFDVVRPANVREVGFFPMPDGATSLELAESNLCLAGSPTGLTVLNVAEPAQPRKVTEYATGRRVLDVAATRAHAYLAVEDSNVHIISLSDPARPSTVGELDVLWYDYDGYPMGALRVWVAGEYAFARSEGANLRLFDIRDPSAATEVGEYKLEYPGSCGDITVDLSIAGSRAYVINQRRQYNEPPSPDGYVRSGLCVLDLADLARPTELSCTCWKPYWGIQVAGSYAYVADPDGGWRILSLVSREQPTAVGFLPLQQGATLMDVREQYAYVAVPGPELHIVSVADPLRPAVVGRYPLGQYPRGLAVRGRYVYVAADRDGLRVLDVGDPSNPTEIGHFGPPPGAVAVAVSASGEYAAIRTGNLCVQMLDVGDPTHPAGTGGYCGPFAHINLAVEAHSVYVLVPDWDLYVLDAAIAPHLAPATRLRLPSGGTSMAVADHWLSTTMSWPDTGLLIMTLADPLHPLPVGEFHTPAVPWGLAVDGDHAYIIDPLAGLVVFRLPKRDQVTASISPMGATIHSTDGTASLTFPRGAVPDTLDLTYRSFWTDVYAGPLQGIGQAFDLRGVFAATGQPAYLSPDRTYTMTVHYAQAALEPVVEHTLALYNWDSAAAGNSRDEATVFTAPGVVEVVMTVTPLDGVCPGGEEMLVNRGDSVGCCYVVSNRSDAAVYDVLLVDDGGTPYDAEDDLSITLAGLADLDGDGAADDLASGASARGQSTITVLGTQANIATVRAEQGGTRWYGQGSATISVAPRLLDLQTTVTNRDGTCPGAQELTVNPYTAVRHCYSVTNVSQVDLLDVQLFEYTYRCGEEPEDIPISLTGTEDLDGDGEADDLAAGATATAEAVHGARAPVTTYVATVSAWRRGRWIREPTTVVDAQNNTIRAVPRRFGLWTVLGEPSASSHPIHR